MATSTVENYLKRLYLEQSCSEEAAMVSMGRLATATGVVPGTATSMVKTLSESGLVTYEPRSGVKLTPSGKKVALHALRRHRLLELFFVKVLGLPIQAVARSLPDAESSTKA
jgi:DtxR family transcriptional regulator, Mn-dependent transcriptional regulator